MDTNTQAEVNNMGLQKSQNSVNKTENNKQYGNILKVIAIDETPFTLVTIETEEKENTFISIGTSRITSMMTEERAKITVRKKDWQLIVSLITIITERVTEQIKLEDKTRNTFQPRNEEEQRAYEQLKKEHRNII